MFVKLIFLCLISLAMAKRVKETIRLTDDNPMAEFSVNMDGGKVRRGTWTIIAPKGKHLYLDCPEVNIHATKKCRQNFIQLKDRSRVLDKFCFPKALSMTLKPRYRFRIIYKTAKRRIGSFRCTVSYVPNIPCGMRNENQRIVGGNETDPNEYPWQVALFRNGRFLCGGSLIHPSWVLTAAHCTAVVSNNDNFVVVLGFHSFSGSNSEFIQEMGVEEIIQNVDYDPSTIDNDISLLKLATPADISNPEVGPICLPFAFEQYDINNVNGTITGWGVLEFGNFQLPDVLMEAVLPILSTESCRRDEFYGTSSITDNMICTYEPGKDSCQGDSGGPLSIVVENKDIQMGVVSWGVRCADVNRPGVYVKVTSYLDWITENTGRDSEAFTVVQPP